MNYLFNEKIASWQDWSKVYQSIPAFEGIILEICRRENIPCEKEDIKNVTPGTHAVFKVHEYIVKVFCPKESGFDGSLDASVEKSAMHAANSFGVECPRIVASGEICDKYVFTYIVMDFIEGTEFKDIREKLSYEEIVDIVSQLKVILKKMNRPSDAIPALDILSEVKKSERLSVLPESLCQDIIQTAESLDFSESVLVHGDITDDNTLVAAGNRLKLIDFADCHLAPWYYELPPIVFSFFGCRRDFIDCFRSEMSMEEFTDYFLKGLVIHDFGPDIIKEFCEKFGYNVQEINSLKDFERIFMNAYKKGVS